MTPPLPIEEERYELFETPTPRFAPDRRTVLRLLGAGLLVLVLSPADPATAQESGRRGGGALPDDCGAWLHLGADGTVTVFTGKAEVGQNTRTALAQAVAEELRIDTGRVRLTMADTDLTPYDAGTFGSRSTPVMAPQLRRAAVAARDALVALAAAAWKADPASLTVDDGAVHRPDGTALAFVRLVDGKALTRTISADAPLTPASRTRVLGRREPKADGLAFVTGRHRYASDLRRDNMLIGRVLRPPQIGAALKTVDIAPAQKRPGATAVHDGAFVGVAAPTTAQADAALAAIRATWTAPATPATDKDLFSQLRGAPKPDGAQTYTVAYIAHVPLEPRAALAEWSGNRLTVWTGTQRPFGVRDELATAFGIPPERVRVIVPDTGSGYGGKHTGEAAVEAARLARAAGRPVRLVWTREEEFSWAYFRPAGVIDVAGTVDANGKIARWSFHNHNSGGSALRSPYDIPEREEAFHRADSPLRQGSYRGLAAAANHFARESHMDDLARAARRDPLAFRRVNATDPRLRGVLDAAAAAFGWESRRAAPGRGFGIAGGTEKGSYSAHCVELTVAPGTGEVRIVRIVAAFECGAVVNPTHLENQVEGSTVMGLGGALFEAVRFTDGRIVNGRMSRYRVPRFKDVPPIQVVLLDRRDLPSAGAGETPIVTIAPAIRNAILDATGVPLFTLPLLPDGKVPDHPAARAKLT